MAGARLFRLQRRADILQVRRLGQSARHPLAVLLVYPNGEAVSRFGFSASRQVGRAVARNRAKRLLREAVRLHLAEVQSGWDCFFIARPPAAGASFAAVEAAVLQLMRRHGLLQTAKGPGPHSLP